MRVDLFFIPFFLDIIGLPWGAVLVLIVCGDALIDTAVLQINVFLCWHPNIRDENSTVLSPNYDIR